MKKIALLIAVSMLGAWAALTLFPGLALKAAIAWERGQAGLERRSVLVDGDPVVYLHGGSGETILLVHGFGGDKDNWTRFATHLTGRYRVIAPDLPGFGESWRKSEARYDIESQVARLKRFAETLGLGPVHVGGNSMGGQIAAIYAARHSDAVRSVGLFAPAGISSPNRSEMSRALEQGSNPLLVNSAPDFDRLLGFIFVVPPSMPAALKSYFAERAAQSRAFNEKIWGDLMDRPAPLEPRLAEIRVRTLILWGNKDRVLDVSGAEVLQAALRQSATVILENCGHVPMVERPEETAEHYLNFLLER